MELENEFGATTELVAGGTGDFDVYLEGKIVFSKKDEHRFPNNGEITHLLRNQA